MSLYPPDAHWCSRNDYDEILHVVREIKAQRVLEFGPGVSTLAIIEGGATHIDACEDDPHWFSVHAERIAATYPVVHMRRYIAEPLVVLCPYAGQYDLAVIDGPKETGKRIPVIAYAMLRSDYVLVALEECGGAFALRHAVEELAEVSGRPVRIDETGPLAGAYALVGPC